MNGDLDIEDMVEQLTRLQEIIEKLLALLHPHRKVKVIVKGQARVVK